MIIIINNYKNNKINQKIYQKLVMKCFSLYIIHNIAARTHPKHHCRGFVFTWLMLPKVNGKPLKWQKMKLMGEISTIKSNSIATKLDFLRIIL